MRLQPVNAFLKLPIVLWPFAAKRGWRDYRDGADASSLEPDLGSGGLRGRPVEYSTLGKSAVDAQAMLVLSVNESLMTLSFLTVPSLVNVRSPALRSLWCGMVMVQSYRGLESEVAAKGPECFVRTATLESRSHGIHLERSCWLGVPCFSQFSARRQAGLGSTRLLKRRVFCNQHEF